MNFAKIRELIEKDEEVLFHGCFNERTVRADLSTRREKRDTYIEYFNKFIDGHRSMFNAVQSQDSALEKKIKKCQKLAKKIKKCQKEASRLLDIVYDY